MFGNHVEWRKKEGVDDIIDTYDFNEINAVKSVYPHGYHNVDKLGRPIYIERVGIMNVPGIFERTTEDRMIRHYV